MGHDDDSSSARHRQCCSNTPPEAYPIVPEVALVISVRQKRREIFKQVSPPTLLERTSGDGGP